MASQRRLTLYMPLTILRKASANTVTQLCASTFDGNDFLASTAFFVNVNSSQDVWLRTNIQNEPM
jgi:hypothetical protein